MKGVVMVVEQKKAETNNVYLHYNEIKKRHDDNPKQV